MFKHILPTPIRLPLLLLLSIFLGACGGDEVAPPVPATATSAAPPTVGVEEEASPTPQPTVPASPTPAATATVVPSPTVQVQRDPDAESVFGAEITLGRGVRTAAVASEGNISWIRYNGIEWAAVEPTEGERLWAQLERVEADLQALAAEELTPIVIVRSTPEWAQQIPGSLCGPIREEALDAFAEFMAEVVTRYGEPPYNVRYWELGNEPDVDPSLIDNSWPFGCWGDLSDPFYGGGYYAEMLKRVYPAVKAANPDAQIVLGGMLLDCDPTNPPDGQQCESSHFFEGILQNEGADYFDVVAYHAYPHWNPAAVDVDLADPRWEHRGGLLLGKLNFIREVMGRYGVEKPVLMNEGGLLCYPGSTGCPGEAFHREQAVYAVRLFARTWANGLAGSIWYTLNAPGWRDGALLTEEMTPLPAFETITFMAELLDGATYVGALGEAALEGYAFEKEGEVHQLYWSNEASKTSLPLPENTIQIRDMFGEPLALDDVVEVGVEPVVVTVQE